MTREIEHTKDNSINNDCKSSSSSSSSINGKNTHYRYRGRGYDWHDPILHWKSTALTTTAEMTKSKNPTKGYGYIRDVVRWYWLKVKKQIGEYSSDERCSTRTPRSLNSVSVIVRATSLTTRRKAELSSSLLAASLRMELECTRRSLIERNARLHYPSVPALSPVCLSVLLCMCQYNIRNSWLPQWPSQWQQLQPSFDIDNPRVQRELHPRAVSVCFQCEQQTWLPSAHTPSISCWVLTEKIRNFTSSILSFSKHAKGLLHFSTIVYPLLRCASRQVLKYPNICVDKHSRINRQTSGIISPRAIMIFCGSAKLPV